MPQHTIDCPACAGSAYVRFSDHKVIYRIEAFSENPRARTRGIRGRIPTATLGERHSVNRQRQTRKLVICSGDRNETTHYLRVKAAQYTDIPQQAWLSEADEVPAVECPQCRFQYGPHTDFIELLSSANPTQNHVLREVALSPKPGHTEVQSLTRRNLANHDRLALEKQCQHCGQTHYFLYRTRAVDQVVTPVEIQRTDS